MSKSKKESIEPKSHWNYRLMALEYESLGRPEILYVIREVHYKNGKPNSYSSVDARVSGDSKKDIKWSLFMMNEALKKPILSIKNFPDIYKKTSK